MDNLYYRHLTTIAGAVILVIAMFRLFDLFKPDDFLLFCISLGVIIYAVIDLILEVKKEIPKKTIMALDFLALVTLLLGPLIIKKVFTGTDLKLFSEVGILLSFGIVIIIIGIKNYKSYYKKIEIINNENYIYKKKTLTLNSDDAILAVQELVRYENNTVFNINKIIQKLKECDREIYHSFKIHDGWGVFLDFYEYHVIKSNYPFYDYRINQLFFEFTKELECAITIFSTLSDPQTSLEINEIMISNETFSVHSFTLLKMEDSIDKYEKAHKHLSIALNNWEKIKSISTNKLEALGASD